MSSDAGSVEIRRLQEADLDAVIEIAKTAEGAPTWSPRIYAELVDPGSQVQRVALVACDFRSAAVVGFVVASVIAPEAELESIAVAPAMQRRGVGQRLFTALAGELRQAGIKDLLLEVRSSNLAAIRFYKAQNFKQTGVRPGYYPDPKEDAVLMSLRL
jgi:ribosomal-protein-alanine N-acetyltransferase